MTKEEKDNLLEEAKARYPVGTVFKSDQLGGRRCTVQKDHYWYGDSSKNILANTGSHGEYIYYNNWAEIVSIPKQEVPYQFKIGDTVRIKTLFSKKGEMNGIIGHVGKIIEISISGFHRLDPCVIGGSFPADCLELYQEPVKQATTDSISEDWCVKLTLKNRQDIIENKTSFNSENVFDLLPKKKKLDIIIVENKKPIIFDLKIKTKQLN